MGPLVPALTLVPVLGFIAWLFSDVFVFADIPVFSVLCFVGIVAVIWIYLAQYVRFAKNDPDRLQSEQYRIQIQRLQMIKAKDLPNYVPAEALGDATSLPDEPAKEIDVDQESNATDPRESEDDSK